MVQQLEHLVSRTCTELRCGQNESTSRTAAPQALAEYQDLAAYVLLGDPGTGKTTSLREEAHRLGKDAQFISARDFVTFDPLNRPDWRGKTLFIDGLDELRTGGTDPRTPFDLIRRNLDSLGKPTFRLSCRHADWLSTDQQHLAQVSQSGDVTLLSLDPLNMKNIRLLLRQNFQISNPQEFILEANKRHIEALLVHPQTLSMLAKTASQNDWPEGRLALFESACRYMAQELNEEHLASNQTIDADLILNTAGRICSILLLSDKPGCSTSPNASGSDYPFIDKVGIATDAWETAISTNLFRLQRNQVEYVHRHIAEFLAARYLAGLVDKGFPILRVLAHMTDKNGNVVSSLRGISAWLAVHSKTARRHLLSRDPVGIALYGDIKVLSDPDKHSLFQSLVSDPLQLEPTYHTAKAFAPSLVPSMYPVLKNLLNSPPNGSNALTIVDFTLSLFAEAGSDSEMIPTFTNLVRDNLQPRHIKESALRALIANTDLDKDSDILVKLLNEVNNKDISDPSDELLGVLLKTLFPSRIPVSKIWDFFRPQNTGSTGAFARFWSRCLLDQSDDEAIATLMDECSSRVEALSSINTPLLRSCTTKLLTRALKRFGDVIGVPKLYDWIAAGVELRVQEHGNRQDELSIRQWIEDRPWLHTLIFLEGINRNISKQQNAPYDALKCLYGIPLSRTFYRECVVRALDQAATNRPIAEIILHFVVRSNALQNQEISSLLVDHPYLTNFINNLSTKEASSRTQTEAKRNQGDVINRAKQAEIDNYEELKKLESELAEGSIRIEILHMLAEEFFDNSLEYTFESAIARVYDLAMSDSSLVSAIKKALQTVSRRQDIPDSDETLRLALKSRMHFLSLPFLASIALAESREDYKPNIWTDDQMRIALSVYFGYAHGTYQPIWYEYMIDNKPEIVAHVLANYSTALLRSNARIGGINLSHLAFNENHSAVAKLAVIPILEKFPIGANKNKLQDLEYLLIAAVRCVDYHQIQKIVAAKLDLKSMPARQRARWLAAGCVVAENKYTQAATEFLNSGRKQSRLLDFLSLFCISPHNDHSLISPSDIELQARLLEISAPYIDPDEFGNGGWITVPIAMSRHLHDYIQNIANSPTVEARKILGRLLKEPSVSKWHPRLSRLARDQQRNRTDHEYSVPKFEQVVTLLDNGAPSNPGDLASWLLYVLEEIGERMSTTNTDDWKQYWTEDGYGRPREPKPENSCTQNIMRALQHRLPDGVHCDIFPSYPGGTSSDLKVSYRNYNVPIEAKCSFHQELWHAARSQLMTKYTKETDTHGYGVFLVYWFGHDKVTRSPQGTYPDSAAKLKRQLVNTLTKEEQEQIYFCVIDVSQQKH